MLLAPDVLGDEIHRSRPVQRNSCNQILNAAGPQLFHEALHPGRLELEDALALPCSDVGVDLRIGVIDLVDIDRAALLLRSHRDRILNHRQRTKPQEIHFQKAKLLDCRHRELCDDSAVLRARDRHKIVHPPLADDNTRRMDGGMAWQSLESPRHINETVDGLVRLVHRLQLLALLQRLVDRDAELLGNHLGDRIAERVGQIHDPPYIPYDTPRRKRSERDNLRHIVPPVLLCDIVDDFLPALIAEVDINIRHRDALRVQEALKQQVEADRVQLRDAERIGNERSGGGTAARSDCDADRAGIAAVIPDDQEIIDVAHPLDDAKFILQPLLELLRDRVVTFLKPLLAELLKVLLRGFPIRDVKLRQLGVAELDLHAAALRYPLCILNRLRRVGKQSRHFLGGLDIILPARIAHAVFIGDLLSRLDAEQHIVRLRILRARVVTVICRNEPDPGLLRQTQKACVHLLLFLETVVLQFQVKVIFSEDVLVLQRRSLRLLIQAV